MKIEKKLEELGITLPEVSPPKAKYVPVRRVGDILYVSGHLPMKEDGSMYTGRLGFDVDVETGQAAALRCAIGIVATLKYVIGDLDAIKGIIKLQSFVSSAPDFYEQHIVTNAASEFFVNVFGEEGQHARSAFGTAALPMNASVEVEAIIEVHSWCTFK